MNNVILMGRLTRDPEIRYSQGENQMAIARFTLAVDRRYNHEGQQSADFISCIAFNKTAEFIEKWTRQGIKLVVEGRIQTGNYTNKEGQKVYTTDVVVESAEFAESKSNSEKFLEKEGENDKSSGTDITNDGFTNIPDGIDDELPFN